MTVPVWIEFWEYQDSRQLISVGDDVNWVLAPVEAGTQDLLRTHTPEWSTELTPSTPPDRSELPDGATGSSGQLHVHGLPSADASSRRVGLLRLLLGGVVDHEVDGVTTSGRVKTIDVVRAAYAMDHQRNAMASIPGSAQLERVEQAQKWPAETDDLAFTGLLVGLEVATFST